MTECKEFESTIESYIAGELLPSELERLHEHCASCQDCQALVDMHLELGSVDRNLPQPRPADLTAMRASVLAQISRDSQRHPDRPGKKLGRGTWALPLYLTVPMAAAALFAAAFLGRWTAAPTGTVDDMILQEVHRQASLEEGLDGYWDTEFSFTNVSMRPVSGGQLGLSFDVCRHVEMVTPKDSPVAREVLMHAILEPAPLGSRMKAMAIASEIHDRELEDAVILAMHSDPELTVRMEALSALTRFPYNAEIQEALLNTLRMDRSVQMRLLCLEHLTHQRVGLETLRQTIDDAEMESNPAILQRAVELTRKS